MLQPFHQAFANEGDGVIENQENVIADAVAEQISDKVADHSVGDDALLSLQSEESEDTNDFSVDLTPLVDDISTTTSSAEESHVVAKDMYTGDTNESASSSLTEIVLGVVSTSTQQSTTITSDTSVATSTDMTADTLSTETEVDDGDITSEDSESDLDLDLETTNDVSEQELPDNDASLTLDEQTPLQVSTGTIVKAENVVTDENFYQFSRQSCVAVGDGTYHCSLNTAPGVDTTSVVYAERDVDGDMEIYLRTANGTVEQITDNELDDTSPHLDIESLQLVWQRLIDDRYQVILYDIEDNEELQLTFSRTNNMEPKISEDGIVWQAWDNNDWEIMHFDGKFTDQLTDNTAQDVAPVIEDGYVLWSVLGNDTQEAMVYALSTGQTMTISDHGGGSIINPRFVLVYDTKFDNGDIVTQGFDPATGLSAPIAAKPAPQPIDIPSSDPTGEIRALIQNKSAQKEKNDLLLPADPGAVPVDHATTTATAPDTLDLKQSQGGLIDSVVITTGVTSADFELTDYDLVIAPTSTNSIVSSSSSTTLR